MHLFIFRLRPFVSELRFVTFVSELPFRNVVSELPFQSFSFQIVVRTFVSELSFHDFSFRTLFQNFGSRTCASNFRFKTFVSELELGEPQTRGWGNPPPAGVGGTGRGNTSKTKIQTTPPGHRSRGDWRGQRTLPALG